MSFKKVVKFAGVLVGAYWIGKLVGVNEGAKAVLNKYGDVIPDDAVTVKLVDNALLAMTVTTKKAKK